MGKWILAFLIAAAVLLLCWKLRGVMLTPVRRGKGQSLELVLVYSLCDSCKLLINDSACADVGVANLGITHLTIRKTYCKSGSCALYKWALLHQLVHNRSV